MLSSRSEANPEASIETRAENDIDLKSTYEGICELPFAERMISRFKLAYNRVWARRHEKKALKLRKKLDSYDIEIGALEREKRDVVERIEFFEREGIPGAGTIRLQLKEKEAKLRKLLDERDEMQSAFNARDAKRKLYADKRDRIADKFIGHYNEKLRPMKDQLVVLHLQKSKLEERILKQAKRHQEILLGRVRDMEIKKQMMAKALSDSGLSERKIQKDKTFQILDRLISQAYSEIQKEKDSQNQTKAVIEDKIAKIKEKTAPYQSKREKYVRIVNGENGQITNLDEESKTSSLAGDVEREKRQKEKEARWLQIADMLNGKKTADIGVENRIVGASGETERERKQREKEEGWSKMADNLNGKKADEVETAPKTDEKPVESGEETGKKADIENSRREAETDRWDEFLTLLVEAEKQKRENEAVTTDEEKFKMARAAAWHTIYKLENSADFTFADLNAKDVEEGNEKFLEITRQLWDEIFVHEKPDQDAKTCLELLKMAGINVDNYGTVPQGRQSESGLTMDSSGKHGVSTEEEGKRLIIDHHSKQSDRATSASKFVYEMLVETGLLQKEEYLDNFINFTTVCDNLNFSPEEMAQVYQNYHKNLYGLSYRMKPEDVMELFRQGINPMADLSEEFLANHYYENPAKKDKDGVNMWDSLASLSKHMENKMKMGEKDLDRLERFDGSQEKTVDNMGPGDFVIDTGEKHFGKIFIDKKRLSGKDKVTGKDRYVKRITGENKSEQLAVFLRGYGGYLVWSPQEDGFVLYTKKKMDEKSLPGGFSQGFNMRGHMWMKPLNKEGEPRVKLTVTLKEVLTNLSGKKKKTTSFERVVGQISEEGKQSILKKAETQFVDQKFEYLKGKEREKTREELKIITLADQCTNETLRKYGLVDFAITPKNVHVIKNEDHMFDGEKTVFLPMLQSMEIVEESSKIHFTEKVIHEMLHFKSYNAMQTTMSDEPQADIYRVGLFVASRDGEKEFFRNLNEAVTAEMTKSIMSGLTTNPLLKKEFEQTNELIANNPGLLKSEEGESIPRDDIFFAEKNNDSGKMRVLTYGYIKEREMLKILIEKILERNRNKFSSREEIYEVFARAAMTGNILPIGKLIDQTFGKGTFRRIGESDADILEQRRMVELLK